MVDAYIKNSIFARSWEKNNHTGVGFNIDDRVFNVLRGSPDVKRFTIKINIYYK